jgi:RNA polymerase sigma-70 factor (ECF subfamily)
MSSSSQAARTSTDEGAVTDDERLAAALEATASGDRSAFSTVYDMTAPRVLGLCRRILIDPHMSEEVAQEVFLEIWQTSSRFDAERGRGLTWILTMAHRRAIDRVRASQSSRDRDLRIGIRDFGEEVPGVESDVETALEFERARAAMGRLTPLQREVLDLAYFGGLTQSEIADRLDTPIGTVKTRMRDALIRLRGLLGETR